MDLEGLQTALCGLRRATDVSGPDGWVSIRRRDVLQAKLDPVEVDRWCAACGGRLVPAPDLILSGQAVWREAARDAVAFQFPPGCLY
jgi:hypothetical protein